MSATLTIDQMTAKLQLRLPMGLTSGRCVDELNQAWRKVEQQGAMVWNLRSATVTMTGNTRTLNLPSDFDPGRPSAIWPVLTFRYPVPYKPAEEFAQQFVFHATMPQGVFSAWTFIYQGTPTPYQAIFAPITAQPTVNQDFTIYYHKIVGPPLVAGANYFPTPDNFDDTLVDLAESEIRRTYNLAGWDIAMKESETAMKILVDKYRSTRDDLGGIQDETFRVNDAALERSK